MKIKNLLEKREVKIFFTIYLVYLVFMTNFGGNFMADSMLSATISLVEQQTFKINDYVSDVCKETGCDHSLYKENYYSGFAPGLTIIALPFYLVSYPFLEYFLEEGMFGNTKTELKLIALNIIVTIFIASLLSALTSVLVYRLSSNFTSSEKTRLTVTFLLAFSTIYFLYSTGYYARIIAASFSIYSFYKLNNLKKYLCPGCNPDKSNIHKTLFISGLSSSIAVTMDYPHILISFVLFLYLLSFFREKKVLYFILGSIIPIVLIMLYHYVIFENPFATPEHLRANKGNYEALVKGIGGFSYPSLEKLYLYSFSPERGIFFYSPIFLLSLYGIYLGFRKYKSEMLAIFFSFFLTYLFYSSNIWPWFFDGSFGPRYLLVTFPYLILPLSLALEKSNKIFTYILIVVSSIISLLGAMFDRTALWTYSYDMKNPIFTSFIPLFLERGFSNYTLNIIDYKIINIPELFINIIFFAEILVLFLIIRKIWNNFKLNKNF